MKAETVTERTDPEGVPGALRAAEGDGATEPGTVRETPDETPADTAGATGTDPQEALADADSAPTGRERPSATPHTDGDDTTEPGAVRETPADPRKAAEEARTGLAAADAAPTGRERPAATPRSDGDGSSEETPDLSDRDGGDDATDAGSPAPAKSDATADREPSATGRPAPSWARTGTKAEPECADGSASDDAANTPPTAAEGDHEDREPAAPAPADGDEEPQAEAAPASDDPEDEQPAGPAPAGSRNDTTAPAAPQGDAPAGETDAGAPEGVKGAAAATDRGTGPEAPEAGKAASTAGTRKPDTGATAPKGGEPDATAGTRKPDTEAAAPAAPGAADGPRTKADATGGPPARRADADADAESDAERTSQFVALKELGAPAGTKALPKVAPTAAPKAPEAPRPHSPAGPEVTREAPLPPLELLAELTNTAPPPETPRRTLTRRVKVWTPIVLLLGGAVVGAQLLRPLPAPRLAGGESSYTLEGNTTIPWPAKGQAAVRLPGSGDVATFGEQKPMPTASVAKVMTAYVILKGHPLRKNDPGPRIEVDAAAVADGKSEDESAVRVLTVGSKYSQLDMLKMMMIPSANNVARLLARWDSGSTTTDAFVAKMNAAAKELGMNDTTYTDPSGLDAGTVSTAADQLKLAEAVMKEEAFRPVVATSQGTVDGLPAPLLNNNASLLLAPNLNIMGIKTGSSTPAGGTLMWAAYKTVGTQDQLILGTMMDQRADGPDPGAARSLELVKENSRKVIGAVRAALAEIPAVRKGQPVGYVDDGLGGRTPLVATKDLSVIGVPGQRLKLSLGAGDKSLPHEAKAGTEVGVLTVGDGDGARSVPVAVGKDLVEPSFGTRVTRLS
ncbi:serine hydrolase [Streptomyces sp. NPDC059104]|uniref:serine hydrolase n=1 Tax=Streptomyces sp. NPDC059104 TaxID=3346729 RepID=UPI00369C8A23